MRRMVLAALAATLMVSAPAAAVEEFIESIGNFHSFKFAAGADTTLKLADFDFDGDGDLDMSVIHQVAYFGSAGEDSLWYHANQGWWNNPLPPSSQAGIPLRTKRFSEIKLRPADGVPAPSDSTVIRYHAVGAGDVYLFVWGS